MHAFEETSLASARLLDEPLSLPEVTGELENLLDIELDPNDAKSVGGGCAARGAHALGVPQEGG